MQDNSLSNQYMQTCPLCHSVFDSREFGSVITHLHDTASSSEYSMLPHFISMLVDEQREGGERTND
jgi:hypothetical protein